MDKLYIATSTLNFNNILATESISPEAFYTNRNFGYKRFTKVEPNPFSNSIIAYDKIPDFKIEESDLDEYPLIIEISKELIKDEIISNRFETNGIKVLQLNETIYLHPNSTNFIFFNEKDKKTSLIKTEPSIETKLLPVYLNRIRLIENKKNSFKWEESLISDISDLSNNEVSKQIDLDSKTNKLKGFYYSYLLGIILSSSIKQITLKEDFISITQSIIDFFNQKENQRRINENINDRLDSLKININNSDGSKVVPKEDLLKSKFLDELNSKELPKFINFLKNTKPNEISFYHQLESEIDRNKNGISVLIDDLQTYLNKPYSKEVLSVKSSRITRYLSNLNQNERKKTDPLFLIQNLNFNGFKITQLTDSFFKKNKADLYRNIVNDVLDYPIDDIQTFKEEKINLAFKIGAILKEYIPNWENSKERNYFNNLMDNIENYQPFEIKSHSSILLQSIAIFIQKGEEPEKLIDSLRKNQLSDYRIALGLWGSIFGFSALPKTLTNLLFEKENIDSTRHLYKDVQSKLHNTNSENSLNIDTVSNQPIIPKETEEQLNPIENKTNILVKPEVGKKGSILTNKPVIDIKPNDSPKCPKCGADMVLREGKFGKFYGCSKYSYSETSCNGTIQLKDIPVRSKIKDKLSAVIIEYVNENGHSKLSDIIPFIKEKINIKYNVSHIESYIKEFLKDELEFAKIEKSSAKAVRVRDKGMFD